MVRNKQTKWAHDMSAERLGETAVGETSKKPHTTYNSLYGKYV